MILFLERVSAGLKNQKHTRHFSFLTFALVVVNAQIIIVQFLFAAGLGIDNERSLVKKKFFRTLG